MFINGADFIENNATLSGGAIHLFNEDSEPFGTVLAILTSKFIGNMVPHSQL